MLLVKIDRPFLKVQNVQILLGSGSGRCLPNLLKNEEAGQHNETARSHYYNPSQK